MALPLTPGSNPFEVIILKDAWTLAAQNVNTAFINNLFPADQEVFVTYVKTGDPAPVGLSVPRWKILAGGLQFDDGVTPRDVYIYPVAENATVIVEA